MSRFFRNMLFLLGAAALIISPLAASVKAAGSPATYPYTIRPGDILWDIAKIFGQGPQDWQAIVEANKISDARKLMPGQVVLIPATRPLGVIKQYLTAVYGRKTNEAYVLLSPDTQERYSPADFDNAMGEITHFDLDSLALISDLKDEKGRRVRIQAQMPDQANNWVFHLVWQDGRWWVHLEDMDITLAIE